MATGVQPTSNQPLAIMLGLYNVQWSRANVIFQRWIYNSPNKNCYKDFRSFQYTLSNLSDFIDIVFVKKFAAECLKMKLLIDICTVLKD